MSANSMSHLLHNSTARAEPNASIADTRYHDNTHGSLQNHHMSPPPPLPPPFAQQQQQHQQQQQQHQSSGHHLPQYQYQNHPNPYPSPQANPFSSATPQPNQIDPLSLPSALHTLPPLTVPSQSLPPSSSSSSLSLSLSTPEAPVTVTSAPTTSSAENQTPPTSAPGSSSSSVLAPAPSPASSSSHSLNQSLYQCADCQKRYSRPEHLARHIQTHTLGKRFVCHICGKAFARADLLKRHTANHENDNDPTKKRRRIGSSPGAGRVAHACRPCAAARVKCEELKPCTRCRNRNMDCEHASFEAGSAATMHVLPISGISVTSANSQPATNDEPSPNTPASPSSGPDGGVPAAEGGSGVVLEGGGSRSRSVMKTENTGLPTDAVFETVTPLGIMASSYVPSPLVDSIPSPFTDFLRNIVYQSSTATARPEEPHGLSIMDFCDNMNYEMTDLDFGLLDQWSMDVFNQPPDLTRAPTPQTSEESVVDMVQMRQNLEKMWTDSPWRWIPEKNSSYVDEGNLVASRDRECTRKFQERQKRADRIISDKLEQSGRDKVFHVLLQTCRTDQLRVRVASSFPSLDLMDSLVHIFLASHSCSVSSWIHWGTLNLNEQHPGWLANAAAAGAVLTPVLTLRKFGFAVQEAVRLWIPERFDENNTTIKKLGLVQALVLGQDLGLWSGNRRMMEISECHLLIPITMMRYRGRFQGHAYPPIAVNAQDEGAVLEKKWHQWCEREGWKRLIFHCYLRDAQCSMTTLAQPIMSFAELTLPLPEAREIWFAKTVQEWKQQYLVRGAGRSKRPPALGDLIRDISVLALDHERIDTRYATSIYLHSFWKLILEWRHLSSVYRTNTLGATYQSNQNLILSSRHQELCRALHSFKVVTTSCRGSLSAQEHLLLNLMLMNMHVSMDDLQLFAGQEGEGEARRIYPILQQWLESADSRQAIWHAGQIIRQAKLFPSGHLKEFYAVSVHHAALALWTYGVVVKATRNSQSLDSDAQDSVYLDGDDDNQVQRFLQLGQGRPGLRARHDQPLEPLDDPRVCMNVVQDVLKSNFPPGNEPLPPIVENLCGLIKQLGGAAWAVGLE